MSDDPYRGGEAARDARIRALDAEIRKLESVFTRVFWERVAPHWRIDPPGAELGGPDPVEARSARIALLGEAAARARRGIEAAPALGPEPAKSGGGLFDSALDDEEVVAALRKIASAQRGTEVQRRGGGRWGLRVRANAVPIDASVVRIGTRNGHYWDWTLSTSCVLTARVHLGPEGIMQDLVEMIGLGTEIELGDSKIDPLFKITGDEVCARALLTPRVCRDLVDLAAGGRLRAGIDGGYARLYFRGTLGARGVPPAMRILAELHRAPSPLPVIAG